MPSPVIKKSQTGGERPLCLPASACRYGLGCTRKQLGKQSFLHHLFVPDLASFTTVAHQPLRTGLVVKQLLPLHFLTEFLLSVFNPSSQGAGIPSLLWKASRVLQRSGCICGCLLTKLCCSVCLRCTKCLRMLLFYILTRLCKRHFRECTEKVTETRK